MTTQKLSSLLLGVTCGVTCLGLLTAEDAAAQPARKPPPVVKACNVSAIPLSVGNVWVYTAVSPPADAPPPQIDTKQAPLRPEKITIKVNSIETKDGVTTVTLNESFDYRVQVEPPLTTTASHDTTITCSGGGAKFQIGMDSFWFAGEAGKPLGIELSDLERKGSTLALAGGKLNTAGVSDWRDDVMASWKHVPVSKATPTMRKGTMNLTRHFVVLLPDQPVGTGLGSWTAKRLGLESTVNLTVDPAPPAPLKPPTLVQNFFWFVDGVGPVQVLNAYGHMFQLTNETKIQ